MLLLLFASLCATKLCQQNAPSQSLIDELRLCRKLKYPFCVEVSASNLKDAQSSVDDLSPSVSHASLTDVRAMAIVADRYLVEKYASQADAGQPSQTCLYYWSLALCSQTFSIIGVEQPLCYSTCKAVADHCTSIFASEHCADVLREGPQSTLGCVDYASQVCNDSCVIDDAQTHQHVPVVFNGATAQRVATQHHELTRRTHPLKHSNAAAALTGVDCLLVALLLLQFALAEYD